MRVPPLSSQRIRIISGIWSEDTQDIPIDRIQSITVKLELLNRWFDIGLLEITSHRGDPSIVLKGLPEPDRLKRQIERLAGLQDITPPPGLSRISR